MSTAFYKGHYIRKLKGHGYDVLGVNYPTLSAATDRIDELTSGSKKRLLRKLLVGKI
jgi:hypothetical protein